MQNRETILGFAFCIFHFGFALACFAIHMNCGGNASPHERNSVICITEERNVRHAGSYSLSFHVALSML